MSSAHNDPSTKITSAQIVYWCTQPEGNLQFTYIAYSPNIALKHMVEIPLSFWIRYDIYVLLVNIISTMIQEITILVGDENIFLNSIEYLINIEVISLYTHWIQ